MAHSPLLPATRGPFRSPRARRLGAVTLALIALSSGTWGSFAQGPIATAASPLRIGADSRALSAGSPVAANPVPAGSSPSKTFPELPGWRAVTTTSHPSARWGAVMASAPASGAIVLFGGEGPSGYLNDSWEFTGTSTSGVWSSLATTGAPSPRAFAAGVFDPALDGIVVFGGLGRSGYLGDTWLLRGTAWSEIATTGPSPRAGAGLAYAPGSGGLVLFGGRNASGPLGDTYEWQGGQWVLETPIFSPSARSDAIFAFDPGRGVAVLEGGSTRTGAASDSYSWNGENWSRDTNVSTGPAAVDASAGYSAADGGLIVAGGNVSGAPSNGTLLLPASGAWVPAHLAVRFSPRTAAAVAFSATAGALILFGGWNDGALSDTWTFSTSTPALTWREQNSTATPPPRTQGALAYDPADGYLVLFGGEEKSSGSAPLGIHPSATVDLGDTWVYRDGNWTELFPSPSPSPREGAMFAFDPVDGYLVLFGGADVSSSGTVGLNDTWAFHNGTWTQLFPSSAPTPRRGAGFAFDAADGFLVLYGGRNGSDPGSYTFYHDTWSFSGGQWTKLTPTGKTPPAVSQPQFTFDPTTGAVVLNGGYAANVTAGTPTPIPYTWTFAADHWTNLSGTLGKTVPEARGGAAFVYDPAVEGVVLLGGSNATVSFTDVWTFRDGTFSRSCAACALRLKDTGQIAYDDADGTLVAFGISDGANATAQTWLNLSRLGLAVSASSTSVDLGYPVHVTATVGGGVAPLTGAWAFDNGQVNDSDAAEVTFATLGSHVATYTVTDAFGNTTSERLAIDVVALPSVSLTATPWGPGLYSARLNATVTGGAPPFSYAFQFGDGTSANGSAATVVHEYGAGGAYSASVTVTDALGNSASANASAVALPSTPPTVTVHASALGRASPVSIGLTATSNDSFGGDVYTWAVATFPGTNFTHITIKGSGSSATLNVPKALALNATARVWANLTDAANFTASTSTLITIYSALHGVIGETILSTPSCPVRANSTRVELTENVTGGDPGYVASWTVGTLVLSGPNVTAELTPGQSVPVALLLTDAAGDNYSLAKDVLVPALTCAPSSVSARTLLLFGGVAVVLVVVIALEVVHLRRSRRARSAPPPAEEPTGAEPPATPPPSDPTPPTPPG